MKHISYLLLALLLTLFTTSLLAGSNSASRETIEKNYIQGVQSENEGLKISAAYFLGELKSTKAVIPLMKILRDDKCDGARLAAALALVKIGEPRGLFMVKRSAVFNDCEKVRKMAKQLYTAYLFGSKTKDMVDEEVSSAIAALK